MDSCFAWILEFMCDHKFQNTLLAWEKPLNLDVRGYKDCGCEVGIPLIFMSYDG